MSGALKIAVIGAGNVGGNLARRFVELGHSVTLGARDPASDKVQAVVAAVPGIGVADVAGAVPGADMVVLAVPYPALAGLLEGMDLGDGTVVIDATNAVGVALEAGDEHVVQLISRHLPDAQVVKAFNTIGAEAFLDPQIGGQRLFLPVAGPEPAAGVVRDLAHAMGFDALVIGGHECVRMLEEHARLWIHLAFPVGLGRGLGFARLNRTA